VVPRRAAVATTPDRECAEGARLLPAFPGPTRGPQTFVLEQGTRNGRTVHAFHTGRLPSRARKTLGSSSPRAMGSSALVTPQETGSCGRLPLGYPAVQVKRLATRPPDNRAAAPAIPTRPGPHRQDSRVGERVSSQREGKIPPRRWRAGRGDRRRVPDRKAAADRALRKASFVLPKSRPLPSESRSSAQIDFVEPRPVLREARQKRRALPLPAAADTPIPALFTVGGRAAPSRTSWDTGLTLNYLCKLLRLRQPASLRSGDPASTARKPPRLVEDLPRSTTSASRVAWTSFFVSGPYGPPFFRHRRALGNLPDLPLAKL